MASATAVPEVIEEDLPSYFPGAVESPADHPDEQCEGVEGAEAEICELMGFDMGECLDREIGMPFNNEERHAAYESCGYFSAKPSQRPSAIWLIGPSACGKSTLAPQMAESFGLTQDGYVMVDGESFRDSHQGFLHAIKEGKNKGCVWWGAYVGIRENINNEKQDLLVKAMREQKNLIIPSTCLRRSQSVDVAKVLQQNGYLIHIVGVYGDKEKIVKRGRLRAQQKGKRYNPREFDFALTMFAPMLRLCTGKYSMVCTTGKERFTISESGEGPLQEHQVRQICESVFESYLPK